MPACPSSVGWSSGRPLTGGPFWVEDPAVRAEDLVGSLELPPGATGEVSLLAAIEPLLAARLDRTLPLWRIWCITGSPERTAILFVCHHALADGLGAMRLARALLGDDTVGPEAVPLEAWPGRRDLIVDNVRGNLVALGRLLRPAGWRAIIAFGGSMLAAWRTTRSEPPTMLNIPVGPHRRMVVRQFDEGAVKRVARSNSAGMNDVMLALAASALRSIEAFREEPLDGHIRAGLAVALPASARRDRGGNQFGSHVVELPLAESDPATRVHRIAVARERAKRTQPISGVTTVRVWTTRLPLTRWLMARQRFIHVMETFLPGPPRPIHLLGARVLDVIPIQPLGRDVGLTFIASSYAGRVTLAVRADPDAFPDLDIAMAAIERDWRRLSADVWTSPGERRATTTDRAA